MIPTFKLFPRPKTPALSVMGLSLGLLLGLVACKGGESSDAGAKAGIAPDEGESGALIFHDAPQMICKDTTKPCHLFDHIADAKIEGLAKAAALLEHEPITEVVLDVDFEDGKMAPFLPFDGSTGAPVVASEAARPKVKVQGQPGAKSLEMTAKGKGGVAACTSLMPVDASEFYTLSYGISGENLVSGGRDKAFYGVMSVEFFNFSPRHLQNLESTLSQAAIVNRARVRAVGLDIPQYSGNFERRDIEKSFTPPSRASHMMLCLNLSRPKDMGAQQRARGTVHFDDVKVVKERRPPHRRTVKYERGFGPDYPLKTTLQMRNAISAVSSERRYGLYAPGDSTLTYRLTLPEGAKLTYGVGVLPQVRQLGPLTYEVAVKSEDKTSVVHTFDWNTQRSRYWQDQVVDLSAYGGKTVDLILRTTGKKVAKGEGSENQKTEPAAAKFDGPAGGAIWGYPVVEGSDKGGKDIVLFVFDTLPAKRTSTYGYGVDTTPNLTKIAQESVKFNRAMTPAPWTLPSFATMMTGLWPATHRAGEITPLTRWRRIPLESRYETLAQHLRANGYETQAWVNNPYLNAEISGLHVGFSKYVDYGTRGQVEAAKGAIAEVLAEISKPSAVDRFFFVHLMDPHGPYRPNPEYRKKFLAPNYKGSIPSEFTNDVFVKVIRSQLDMKPRDYRRVEEFYESVVAYSDAQLGQVFNAAKANSEDLLFMITSDHGEEFWEHDYFEHGHSLYDEVLKLPMVVYRSGQEKEAKARDDLVSLIDVVPTILDEAGLGSRYEGPGRSMFSGATDNRDHFALNMLYGPYRYGVESGHYKYTYTAHGSRRAHFRSSDKPVSYELYDLSKDGDEKVNIFEKHRDLAYEMHDKMVLHFAQTCQGCIFIYADGPGQERIEFDLKAKLGPGSSWQNEARTLSWPAKSGKTRISDANLLRGQKATMASLHGEAERSVFFLLPSEWQGDLTFAVDYPITAATKAPVFYGPKFTASPGESQVSQGDLLFDHGAFKALIQGTPSATPRLVIGRLPGAQNQRDNASMSGEGGDDLEAGLKVLGYLED